MPAFRISTRFHPIRLTAFMRNNVEMSIEIENSGKEPLWTECDVAIPESISLAQDKDLHRGRLRIGIVNPGEILTGKCKIFASARSYPETYTMKVTVYGFGRDGAIAAREDKSVDLRCEQLGR